MDSKLSPVPAPRQERLALAHENGGRITRADVAGSAESETEILIDNLRT
jgi:hypothetical protein